MEKVVQDDVYFAFSATLRIHGRDLDFKEIERALGLKPTHVHVEGGSRKIGSKTKYKDDAWHYGAGCQENEPLAVHLNALCQALSPHAQYLRRLKEMHKVDIFCGYRSNCDHAGFEIPHECLRIFTELQVPFGLSVIVVVDD